MILGADGYLGWPTAVDLAFKKHKLMLVDSYIKRKIMTKMNREPLVKSPTLSTKVRKLNKAGCNLKWVAKRSIKIIGVKKINEINY